jgi:hypothetical protein
MKRRIIPLLLAAMLALALTAPPAFATGGASEKCNAGVGNGGEYIFHDECDPGKSGAHNNAGDTD